MVGGIIKNKSNNLEFFENNFEINYNLFFIASNLKVKNIINLGSSCMYPKIYKTKFKEKHLMTNILENTNFGYSLSKLSTSFYLKLLKDKLKLNYVTIIPCNLYGPNDNFDYNKSHLIPAIIRKVIEAKKFHKKYVFAWGDGSPKREFMYVDDLASLVLKMIKTKKKLPDFINAGYGKDFTVKYFYKKIIKIIDHKILIKWDKTKPNGTKRKLINSNLAMKLFKWKPKISLDDGLKKTILFYSNKKT